MKMNQTKSFVLVEGTKLTKYHTLSIEGWKLEIVDSFNYLGIIFNRKNTWLDIVFNRATVMEKSIVGIFRFTKKLGSKPLNVIKKIYKA